MILADFTEMPPTLKVDIVLMSLVLLHIPDTRKILRILYSVLNEGAKLIIVDFDKNAKVSHPMVHHGFSHENLKRTLSEVGFSFTSMQTFYNGKGIFMNQDASMFKAISLK